MTTAFHRVVIHWIEIWWPIWIGIFLDWLASHHPREPRGYILSPVPRSQKILFQGARNERQNITPVFPRMASHTCEKFIVFQHENDASQSWLSYFNLGLLFNFQLALTCFINLTLSLSKIVEFSPVKILAWIVLKTGLTSTKWIEILSSRILNFFNTYPTVKNWLIIIGFH